MPSQAPPTNAPIARYSSPKPATITPSAALSITNAATPNRYHPPQRPTSPSATDRRFRRGVLNRQTVPSQAPITPPIARHGAMPPRHRRAKPRHRPPPSPPPLDVSTATPRRFAPSALPPPPHPRPMAPSQKRRPIQPPPKTTLRASSAPIHLVAYPITTPHSARAATTPPNSASSLDTRPIAPAT